MGRIPKKKSNDNIFVVEKLLKKRLSNGKSKLYIFIINY
jgi:hypothetical protein